MDRHIAGTLMVLMAAQVEAAATNSAAFVGVPTLGDLGLVGLAAVVAVAGGFAARRRRK